MNEAEVDKCSNVMLPGFRFHPTEEELVGFYLKRKIQQRTLPIELIKQLDIYQYDPWDLPKASWAPTGEKEWYFYCLRDRKYRNSARPNRVTKAGFWKATGTDRPVHSSDGKCIGLKKSLVFYRGRAARGTKTDWMMHEFRLPLLPAPPKKPNLPVLDSWTICKIFRKPSARAQRVWVSPLPGAMEEEPGMVSPSRFASRASPRNTMSLPREMPECSEMLLNQTLCSPIEVEENDAGQMKNPGWEGIQSIGIPFSLSPSVWRPGLPWEPSLAGPTDIPTTGYRI